VSDSARIVVELPAELVDEIVERLKPIVVDELRAEQESPYLTVTEAAALLRAKPQRIYDLFSDGRLRRYGSAGARLVSRAELVAFAENGSEARC
jgi:excisionase family DNA binding protein